MKTWLIAGGIIGVLVIGGAVAIGIIVGREFGGPVYEGPLDPARKRVASAMTAACLEQKKVTKALCECVGEKTPRYLTDAEAKTMFDPRNDATTRKQLTARLERAAGRAGFLCGVAEATRETGKK